MCSASCFLFTLAFSTCSVLIFSLSDHLPLPFATISLRSAAIQTFLLYDRIKCPKQLLSDWASLMTTVLHADCSKVLLTTRHDPQHCVAQQWLFSSSQQFCSISWFLLREERYFSTGCFFSLNVNTYQKVLLDVMGFEAVLFLTSLSQEDSIFSAAR